MALLIVEFIKLALNMVLMNILKLHTKFEPIFIDII